jgi:hypothetical protein
LSNSAANSAGPLLAGWLFDACSYQAGFAVLAAATAAVLAFCAWLLRDLSPAPGGLFLSKPATITSLSSPRRDPS